MDKTYYIYILGSGKNGTLYIGTTSDLIKRVKRHKNKQANTFTKRYNVNKLLYYEPVDKGEAFKREKQMKAWKRAWKIELIENKNPNWQDLYKEDGSQL